MKKQILFLLIVILNVSIFGGDPSRKGTTGAEQLLIPVGARSIATGGAFVSNVTGLEAIYYNPAGLDIAHRTEAMFSQMSYLADINVSYFAIGTSFGDFGSIALSFKTFDFGSIPVTTFDSPDGTGATYSPSFLTAGLTYSKIITDKVTIGVNAKVISETILSTSATGLALDFGVQYRFQENLSIGAAVKNIGTNMQYLGQDLQVKTTMPGSQPGTQNAVYEAVTEPFQIPSFFELSVGYNYPIDDNNEIQVGTTFVNNNSLEDQLRFGLEYAFMKNFYVRAGYNGQVQNNDQSIYRFTFGAGVDYNFSDEIGIVFDYAFREVKEFPQPNHVFTVKLSLQ
jgi:opacity protein-like surface antigen